MLISHFFYLFHALEFFIGTVKTRISLRHCATAYADMSVHCFLLCVKLVLLCDVAVLNRADLLYLEEAPNLSQGYKMIEDKSLWKPGVI